MSEAEREKWNQRYAAGDCEPPRQPARLLAEWISRLPRGRALDVACGAGRNALFLAGAGYEVDAIDISSVGLERGRALARERNLDVHWICADLDVEPERSLPEGAYDLIVWIRYVNPGLIPHVVSRLRPGGHLVCEQHLVAADEVLGPKSSAFRLRPGELRSSAHGLRVLHDYEGLLLDADGKATAVAQLVASKPE
jgi:SAM-dependent methyltransferase